MLLGIKLPPVGESSPTFTSSLVLSALLIHPLCHPIKVIGTDCPPACLLSTLCGFFEVVALGRAAAHLNRYAAQVARLMSAFTLQLKVKS